MRITCIRGNTNLISLPFILHGFGHDFVRSQASCRSSLDPLVQFAAGYPLECSLNVYGLDDVPGHCLGRSLQVARGPCRGRWRDATKTLHDALVKLHDIQCSRLLYDQVPYRAMTTLVTIAPYYTYLSRKIWCMGHPKGLFVVVMENFSWRVRHPLRIVGVNYI